MNAVRSTLFMLYAIVWSVLSAPLVIVAGPLLGGKWAYRFGRLWRLGTQFGVEHILGIRPRVIGQENMPLEPCVILAKHQSAWETLAFQLIFPPQVWVLKKELLRVPFFGWGLAMLSPIAIDRSSRREALQQLIEQGRQRLQSGFSIVIFPEGTRIAPGRRGKYRPGGARLAVQTGTPVLPVAHNAGLRWGRNAFLKHPGLVTVSIGAPINPEGLDAESLITRVEQWIEDEMPRLDAR